MEPNNFEVITTTDKEKRDSIYRELRYTGNELERKAVRFSGAEPVMDESMGSLSQLVEVIQYTATGKGGKVNLGKKQYRPRWISTWSVAYPTTYDLGGN